MFHISRAFCSLCILTAFLVCGFGYADQMAPSMIALVAIGATVSGVLLVRRLALLAHAISYGRANRAPFQELTPEQRAEQDARLDAARQRNRDGEASERAERTAARFRGVLLELARHSEGTDLIGGLARLIEASATKLDLEVIPKLELIALEVAAELRSDEPSLFEHHDDLARVVGRWSTCFALRLEQLGIRPSFSQRQTVNRTATRWLNRALRSPPNISPPPAESMAPPRVDSVGGLS